MDYLELQDEISRQLSAVSKGFKRWQFGNKKQLGFLEDFYTLVNDGIPPNRAVDMMAQVTTGLTQEVALSLSDKIGEGQPLADGMSEWFAPNVVEIIRVGEAGGALAQTIKSAINMLSQQGAAIGSLISAIAYPLVVVVIACCVIVYLEGQVFVEFAKIKPVAEWPDAGRQLLSLAHFIRNFWWAVIAGVIAVIIAFKYIMANYTGMMRADLDKIPPFTFYRQLTAARFLETLGLLVSNGVVFKNAITVMQQQANPYLLSHLIHMESLLSKGKSNIAEVLETDLVDHQDLMRLRVMAEVKGFEHGLVRMGIRGTENTTATLKMIARAVGGIFLIVGGILILMIIRGIFMTAMAMGQT